MSDGVVDVDALLAGSIKVGRSRVVTYDDKNIKLHELPAAVIWAHSDEISAEINARDDGGDTDTDAKADAKRETRRMAGMVARFMKGPDFEPTEEQITAMIDNMSAGLMQKVYLAGMNFNGRDLPEDALKKPSLPAPD